MDFFQISKIDISDRHKMPVKLSSPRPPSTVSEHANSIIHTKTFKPLHSDASVERRRTEIVANNYVKFRAAQGLKKARKRIKKPVIFPSSYTNREVLQIPCFTFPKLNEQQIIKGRRTLCKLLNQHQGLISEPVKRLRGINDVSILRHLLFKHERCLRRKYTRHQKTLLLRNGIDFKHLFENSRIRVENPIKQKIIDNDEDTQLLRQYYLKRLSARAKRDPKECDNLLETASRCYVEGFQWHVSYLEVCAAKSVTLCQEYAKKQQKRSDNRDMSEALFFTTKIENYCDSSNDLLVDKLNELNLHDNNLPTITLTDFSGEDSSETNSVIFVNRETQLRAPSIACHVEARPGSSESA